MDIMAAVWLSGVLSFVFLGWAWSVKEDSGAYKILSIIGWALCGWFVLSGFVAVSIHYLR